MGIGMQPISAEETECRGGSWGPSTAVGMLGQQHLNSRHEETRQVSQAGQFCPGLSSCPVKVLCDRRTQQQETTCPSPCRTLWLHRAAPSATGCCTQRVWWNNTVAPSSLLQLAHLLFYCMQCIFVFYSKCAILLDFVATYSLCYLFSYFVLRLMLL